MQDLKPVRVTGVLAVACVVVFVAQGYDPFVTEVGSLIPALVFDGQWWRVATSHFLHAAESHLVLNLAGILAFGWILERVLGSSALLLVVVASSLGSAVASALGGHAQVLGASAIVHGIVGGIVSIEFIAPERLSDRWRLSRGFFVVAVGSDLAAGFLFPDIAGGAHLGGFVGGAAVIALILSDYTPWPWPRRLATLAVAGLLVCAVSVALAVEPLLSREPRAIAGYGADLVHHDLGSARRLDELAWALVAWREPTPEQLAIAQAMALRAVQKSGALDPALLDTLAETAFLENDRAAALQITARAVSLSGGDRYFIERWRRLERREVGEPLANQPRFAPGTARYFLWEPSGTGI